MAVTGLTKHILWVSLPSQPHFLITLLMFFRTPSKTHQFEFLSLYVKELTQSKASSKLQDFFHLALPLTGISRIIHPKQFFFQLVLPLSHSILYPTSYTSANSLKASLSQILQFYLGNIFQSCPSLFIPTTAIPCLVLTISNLEFSLFFF